MFSQINSYQEVAAFTLLFGHQESQKQYDLTNEQLNEIMSETDFTLLGMVQSIKKLVIDLSKKIQHTQPIIAKFTGVPAFMVSKIIEEAMDSPQDQKEENAKSQEIKRQPKNQQNVGQNQDKTLKLNQNLSDIFKTQNEVEKGHEDFQESYQKQDQNELGENSSRKKNKCQFCNASFSAKKLLKEHVKANHKKQKRDGDKVNCEHCNKGFKTQKKYQKHLKQKHNIENQLENNVNKQEDAQNNEEDSNAQNESRRKRGPKVKKNFPCDLCNKIFFHSYYRYIHIKDIHDGKIRGKAPIKPEEEEKFMYKCDNCDFLAEDTNQYEAHKLMHTLNQEGNLNAQQSNGYLKCVKCAKACLNLEELKVHITENHKDEVFEKLYDSNGTPLNQIQQILQFFFYFLKRLLTLLNDLNSFQTILQEHQHQFQQAQVILQELESKILSDTSLQIRVLQNNFDYYKEFASRSKSSHSYKKHLTKKRLTQKSVHQHKRPQEDYFIQESSILRYFYLRLYIIISLHEYKILNINLHKIQIPSQYCNANQNNHKDAQYLNSS